jgi:hypothetical protein
MKLAGRVIASMGASSFLLVFIGDIAAGGPHPFAWEGASVVGVGVVAIAGAALSWWREAPAAVVLICASVLIGIQIAVYAGRYHVLVWSAMGLPYLVAGLLLLASERRARRSSTIP